MWKIPLSKTYFDREEKEALIRQIDSGWVSMGETTYKFEVSLKTKLNVSFCSIVSNCTAALHIACSALGFKPGDEIIVPSLTFIATANAVLYTGATPVFADIESLEVPVISLRTITKKVTEKTRGIILVHYAGYQYDIEAIKAFADANSIWLIEDCAHALGSFVNNSALGTIGDIGCFSFFGNKNITTGEGGAIVTNNEEVHQKILKMRSHGMTSLSWDKFKGHQINKNIETLGYNYRFDDLRASMGLVQLEKLPEINEKRRMLVQKYIGELDRVRGLIIPFKEYEQIYSAHIFPIVCLLPEKKHKIIRSLNKNLIQTSHHYPPIHKYDLYKKNHQELPITENFSERELTLPLFPELKISEVEEICSIIIGELI